MTIQLQPPDKVVSRKRKAHTKSRRGCGNCKLRRVKCDETKPRCKRCIAYTVSCSYDPESLSELQPSVAGAFSIEIPRKLPCSLEQTILGTLNTSASNPAYLLDSLDLKLLSKFQARTVLTIGTPKTSLICQSEMPKIALAHPFLLHIILTLTLLHDRHLSSSRTARYSVAESFHWYRGTALLNAKLSAPLLPSERQAVWATAGLLGAIAFSAINAKLPEEAWPLAPPSSNDLHWLRMSDGKKQFAMRATNADSFIVQAMATEFENDFRPTSSLKESELDDLPSDFITLYGLNPTSSSDNNPYFAAISILVRLLPMTCTHATVIKFMSFTTHMQPELKILLSQKDPRALLLLAYWYAEICQYPQWWCRPRSTLECQAICIYLERYHGDDPNIQKLLPHPRMMCGLLPT